MKKIFAMLPCYNEQEDIQPLVKKWVALRNQFEQKGYEVQVYCVDDKSTDNTNAVIRGLEQTHPACVHLIEHAVNKGLGGALQTSFNFFHANGKDGDLCILMDGDNTHDPVYALSMLPKIESGSDCVIASRYCESSETKGVAPIRLLMSWGARVFYTVILQVKNVKDYTCGYRAYTYPIIDKANAAYGDSLVEHRSFACMMEVLYKLSLLGASFSEIPFELRYDFKQGESKMRILKTVRESIGTSLQLRFHTKKIK